MATPAIVRKYKYGIEQGTKLRLEDGWSVALGNCGFVVGYKDAAGKAHTGMMARICVWDGKAPKSVELLVFEGDIFEAGTRYQVLKIHKSLIPAVAPGSSHDYIVIGVVDLMP